MTYDQIIANIKKRNFAQIYFLMGEEPYFIDSISNLIEETVLDESEKAFNQIIIYGRDVNSISDVAQQARNFPMMGDHLVVIVKEAQSIDDVEELDKYLDKIPSTTILVIDYKYKKLDKRKALSKNIEKHGVLFESKRLYDSNIPSWIEQSLAEEGHKITPKATQMLADFIGNDLHKISNELQKLIVALPKKVTYDENDVEYNIGISKDFNIFELQNAIGSRNILKANQIATYFGDNSKDNPLIVTNIMLYTYFTKLLKCHYSKDKSSANLAMVIGCSPYFVKDYIVATKNYTIAQCVKAIEILRQYDMYSKGYGCGTISEKDLYKELIYKLMH